MSQNFTRLVKKQLVDLFNGMGFKKKGFCFYKRITDQVSLTISYMVASRQEVGHVYVSPDIGILRHDIGRIYEKYKGYPITATVCTSLGYIMPCKKWYEFDFVENDDNVGVLEEIKNNIITHGYVFCKNLETLDEIENYYSLNTGSFEIYYLPIIYYLQGNKEKGIEYIEAQIAKNKQKGEKTKVTYSEVNTEEYHEETYHVHQYDNEYERFYEFFRQLPEKYNLEDWK
ncbi:MAG: hypothetical protein M0P12_05130 [Paludibacteraceae bacterium]|nr:hypothetical protein [Paludibacteraceae bacterium]